MVKTTRQTRRQFLATCAALSVGSLGCGTILHPERRGQPAGELDWGIVALDAVGLLFFFVPGVIAFAVDFSNGTIYLPPYRYGEMDSNAPHAALQRVTVPRKKLTRKGIEAVLARQSGHHVTLEAGEYEATELASIDAFWPTYEQRLYRPI